jgi:hypothetical protein
MRPPSVVSALPRDLRAGRIQAMNAWSSQRRKLALDDGVETGNFACSTDAIA